jgi:hypothetical protein
MPLTWTKSDRLLGLFPPSLFNTLMAKLAAFWTEGQDKATPRD